jgi:hypothetical protein
MLQLATEPLLAIVVTCSFRSTCCWIVATESEEESKGTGVHYGVHVKSCTRGHPQ